MQGAGRDLRPDTITPAPDIFSTEAAVIQNTGAFVEEERPSTLDVEGHGAASGTVQMSDEEYEDSPISPRGDFASEASAPEVQTSSEPAAPSEGEPAPVENESDDEAEDASARRISSVTRSRRLLQRGRATAARLKTLLRPRSAARSPERVKGLKRRLET